MTTPTTPGGGGKTLGDELRELAAGQHSLAIKSRERRAEDKQWQAIGAEEAFYHAADMADARDRQLLAAVADLRREAVHLREQVDPAFYLDWRNACAREQDKSADRIEAAMRGGGTEAGEG